MCLTVVVQSIFAQTEFLQPVTELKDGAEYAIRNANETLTMRNLYWGSWNNCLQTRMTGAVDDLVFIARQTNDGYWTFQVTSPENWGWYLGRYGANNVSCLREVTEWSTTYVQSMDIDGSGFVLLPKGDTPNEGHEMMMNQGGDWVVSFSGSSTDKMPNTSHWEFLLIPSEVTTTTYGDYPIQNVNFSHVRLSDNFWLPRMQQNQAITIPVALQQCYDTRRVLNFQKAAAILRGENIGYFDTEYTFDDTDIYKILEGMAYSVQVTPNEELDRKMDELIELIASAQESDGYLFTPRTAGNPAGLHWQVSNIRWQADPDQSHELYCSGHLYEAAVAHYLSTGKRSLLDIAVKNADLLVREFLVGGLTYEPGHQIVEMGLVKLYRVTGNEDYLRLAKYFLDLRGTLGYSRSTNNQTHQPVLLQKEAVGHAVRAVYMYSGMADVAAIMGEDDYLKAVDTIWNNMVSKKYYVTGGIGARHYGEEFGDNYELPNSSAYCETCAAIGNVYWNWRMFLLHGEAKYYDVLERTLYNGVLSGISLSGNRFFYPNPLESHGGYERSEWFGCACCPSNLCRFLASVPGYIYAHKDEKVYVNLYAQGTADIDLGTEYGTLSLTQTTGYPWSGDISIELSNCQLTNNQVSLLLRLPGWAQGKPVPSDLYEYVDNEHNAVTLFVNGMETDYTMQDGYMVVTREWLDGDIVSFTLPMDVHHVLAHNSVTEDEGKVALERGPLVYCLESIDNDGEIFSCIIPDDAEVQIAESTLAGHEITTLVINGQDKCYAEDGSITTSPRLITAIPYYTWANRGGNAMTVWPSRTSDKAIVSNANRTIDSVDTGNADSENAHQGSYTIGSNTGTFANETWRDTPGGGFVQYVLCNPDGITENISILLRLTTNDAGRSAIITLDDHHLLTLEVAKATRHADSNGMYDVEIPIPNELLVDANGQAKKTLTFRMTSNQASSSIPGLFYLRLLSPSLQNGYQFVATEWKTCDEKRLSQQNISYDSEANILTANAGTIPYNVSLGLDLTTDYTCLATPWLIVRGTNLSEDPSANVLWWLNGVNNGSSLPADAVFTIAESGEVVVVWNLALCALNANCKGDWWNITTGLTCFGLTSTTGSSVISYIGFESDVEEFLKVANIKELQSNVHYEQHGYVYDLSGSRVIFDDKLSPGIYITDGRKIWKR